MQRGEADEFAKLKDVLGRLWEKLRDLGSTPILLGVPGNHDLVRQKAGNAAVASLRTGWADTHVQKEFWENPKSDYRKVVQKAFKNYLAWWEACTLPRPDTYRPGLLPGDFSATLEKGGCKLGIVGPEYHLPPDGRGRLHGQACLISPVCRSRSRNWRKFSCINLRPPIRPF